jgi:hypothetical protein
MKRNFRRRGEPGFKLVLRFDYGHRLRMQRFDDIVRCRRQKANSRRAVDRIAFRAAHAMPIAMPAKG